jgi:DNA recombination protein RmuC
MTPMDSYLPWIFATLATIGLLAVSALAIGASRRHRAEVETLQARIGRLEETNNDLRDKAARLPDANDRAARAEAECVERLQRLDEISSRYAALQATEQASIRSRADLQASFEREQRNAADLRLQLEQMQQRLSRAEADLGASNSTLAEIRRQGVDLRADNVRLNTELAQALQKAAQAEAERDAARALQERTHQFLVDAQSTLRTSFTEAASKVFDEKSQSLEKRITDSADASKAGLQDTLKPFAEHVAQFQQRLEAITSENTKARSELSGKIDALSTLNQNMAASADSLTRALKGNAKARGDWGEMMLDNVLSASGLKEGINYLRQPLEHNEDSGGRQRPDVVVTLPDARKVVVDSKVSLVAWWDAVNADDSGLESAALQKHVAAMRRHIVELSSSNYPALYPGEALQITIAFVPIESALSKALELSPDLQQEAFRRGIAFATPNTLMAMLQVVERLWMRDTLHKQIETIGDEAGKLLDSLSTFLSDFEAIEQSFETADKKLKQARSKLDTSAQSVLARARRLVKAGARGKRKLHASLSATAEEEEALPLLGDAATDHAAAGDEAREIPENDGDAPESG